MRYKSLVIITIATLGFFSSGFATDIENLFDQRMSRRSTLPFPANNPEFAENLPYSKTLQNRAEVLFGDYKVNSDNSTSTFDQRDCDVAHFADGRGVVVWEDERNGNWRVVAQPLSVSGAAVGANRFIDSGNPPVTLRQPRVASNAAGLVLMVYVKENNNGLYGKTFDYSFNSSGTEIRIDDATSGNFINQPEIALISANRFVVVWEDSREGSNIFAQILNSNGSLSGGNFRINAPVESPFRIAPSVVSTLAGDFAVVWEEGRTGNGDVYLRIFTDVGTPLFPELILDANFIADYQFMPRLAFLKGTGYLAAWISDRNGGQSVYSQVISTSSTPIGTPIRVNDSDSDVCWDLSTENTSDSGAVCIWTEYSSSASIEIQKISKAGTTVGGNIKIEDVGLMLERGFPALSRSANGFTGVWVDQRDGNLDIFAQSITSGLAKTGNNYRLNDDVNGAQQLTPDIAGVSANALAVAWHDRSSDQGDIKMQFVSAAGLPLGFELKINDDAGSAVQKNPRVDASSSGQLWAVWEDTRTSGGLQGQNIFAQRLSSSGLPQGVNILVNNDGTSRPKSRPDLDVLPDGRAFITWIDERDNSRQVYLQRFNASGLAIGANLKVSNSVALVENLEAHIAAGSDGSHVVAWMSIIGGRQSAFFQQYNAANTPLGSIQMLAVDTSNVQILDIDVCSNGADGRFYISTIEDENGEISVKMYSFDALGSLIIDAIAVSDAPADHSDVRITADVDDGIAVSWLKASGTGARGQMQLMRNDGFALGSNRQVSNSSTIRLEESPSATMIGGYLYSVWADNRNAGSGFDIYANSVQYTATNADERDDNVLPHGFTLEQNFPNPFNPETTIQYAIQKANHVKLTIFNLLGQELGCLVDEFQPAGRYEIRWNSTENDRNAASGVYFYRLTAGESTITKKMTLLK